MRKREIPIELHQLQTLAEQIGFSHFAPVNTAALISLAEVRAMCASDRCTRYNHSWSCPPACGSVAELGRKISTFQAGLLVQTTGKLEDDFDMDAIRRTEVVHKRHFDTLARQAKLLESGCMPLAAGSCTRCKSCTYPKRPCRYPNLVYPSMEACGLLVSDVCAQSGLGYYYGPQTITYTSCVLIQPITPCD